MRKFSEICESIWSDMQDRGTGNLKKIEDDLNRFTSEYMVDFLNDRYDFCDSFRSYDIYYSGAISTINIPVASESMTDERYIEVEYKKDSSEIIHIRLDTSLVEDAPVVLNALKNQFDVEIKKEWAVVDYYPVGYIYPKNSKELSNNFLIEVLDFIADLDTDKKSIVRK